MYSARALNIRRVVFFFVQRWKIGVGVPLGTLVHCRDDTGSRGELCAVALDEGGSLRFKRRASAVEAPRPSTFGRRHSSSVSAFFFGADGGLLRDSPLYPRLALHG